MRWVVSLAPMLGAAAVRQLHSRVVKLYLQAGRLAGWDWQAGGVVQTPCQVGNHFTGSTGLLSRLCWLWASS
jgi:hypothetical protein